MTPKTKKDAGTVEQVPYGESGGKFYMSFRAHNLERDKADFVEHAGPEVELHATNNGYLVTGETKLVKTTPDDPAPEGKAAVISGTLTFAVSVKPNDNSKA